MIMYDHIEPLEAQDWERLGAPVSVEVVNDTEPASNRKTVNNKTTNIAVLRNAADNTPVLQVFGQTFYRQDFQNARSWLEITVLLLLVIFLLKQIFR